MDAHSSLLSLLCPRKHKLAVDPRHDRASYRGRNMHPPQKRGSKIYKFARVPSFPFGHCLSLSLPLSVSLLYNARGGKK